MRNFCGVLVLLSSLMLCQGTAQAEYRLTWDYVQGSQPLVTFRVYRQYDCEGTFMPLVEVAALDMPFRMYSYVDDTVVPGARYCWKVTGIDTLGQESPATNIVVLTGVPTVSQPTNLRGTAE